MWFRSWEVTMMWKAVTEITGCDAICLHPHTQIGHCLCCVHKLILCVFRVSPSSPTPPCPYTHLEQTADHIDFELMKWHGWMMRLHLWRLNLNSAFKSQFKPVKRTVSFLCLMLVGSMPSWSTNNLCLMLVGSMPSWSTNKKSHDRWQLSTKLGTWYRFSGGGRHGKCLISSLKGRERAIINEMNTGTVTKTTLSKRWEMGWRIHGGFQVHRYHLELKSKQPSL